jgi:ATP-GRASP peptide maturase of grasp-with-spasm system
MILIISEAGDQTTNAVIDWLDHLDVAWVRLNGDSLDDGTSFSLEWDTGAEFTGTSSLGPPPACVAAVWLRRWRAWAVDPATQVLDNSFDAATPADFCVNLSAFRRAELRALTALVLRLYEGKRWLGSPGRTSPNKLHVLATARRCGLAVPATMVTTSRLAARDFLVRHGSIITKPIAEVATLPLGDATYMSYTGRCTDALLARLPETFFPALFQAEVTKSCELRVFYLAGRSYAMAMFSQARERTSVDFRRYDYGDPTRCVPYALPVKVERSIRELMEQLELNTGSLDLILTPDDQHVFLEVNPVGQFGMTSAPCNYRLERRVAEHLRELANADTH